MTLKLPVSVNVSMNISLHVSAVMNWRPVQGVPPPQPLAALIGMNKVTENGVGRTTNERRQCLPGSRLSELLGYLGAVGLSCKHSTDISAPLELTVSTQLLIWPHFHLESYSAHLLSVNPIFAPLFAVSGNSSSEKYVDL